jgi:magnesium-transporting ATPase (P-type)
VDVDFSLKYPILYAAGPNQYYFNYKTFWKWMFQAIYHGFVTFFIVQNGFQGIGSDNGQTNEHWFLSTVSFTILLHIATYKLLLESYYWSMIQV